MRSTSFIDDPADALIYPETDGAPIGESTLQFEWIVRIHNNLDLLFHDHDEVLVAADLFWYPVKGQPGVRTAPDVMLVFGRPRGHRRSYLQWKEGNIAPQVVFEVRSHTNTDAEMASKRDFYERYGVEEYYVYDPDRIVLQGYQRLGAQLVDIPTMTGWKSPRLGIVFHLAAELDLFMPDGQRFLTFAEITDRQRKIERDLRDKEDRLSRLEAQLRAIGIEPEA